MNQLLNMIDELLDSGQLSGKRHKDVVKVILERTDTSQTIRLTESEDTFQLSTTVAEVPIRKKKDDLLFRIWRRNAINPVVTLSLSNTGQVVGEVICPKDSTQASELKFYIETLARDCDRFEYILSGADAF